MSNISESGITSVRISDTTKSALTKIAGEMQQKAGRVVSHEDVIKQLIREHKIKGGNKQ